MPWLPFGNPMKAKNMLQAKLRSLLGQSVHVSLSRLEHARCLSGVSQWLFNLPSLDCALSVTLKGTILQRPGAAWSCIALNLNASHLAECDSLARP